MSTDLNEKTEAYRTGDYAFPAPPVHTSAWDESDWINYIDLCGVWRPRPQAVVYVMGEPWVFDSYNSEGEALYRKASEGDR